jgi:hypothetical protein
MERCNNSAEFCVFATLATRNVPQTPHVVRFPQPMERGTQKNFEFRVSRPLQSVASALYSPRRLVRYQIDTIKEPGAYSSFPFPHLSPLSRLGLFPFPLLGWPATSRVEDGFSPFVAATRSEDGSLQVAAGEFAPRTGCRRRRWLRGGAGARGRQDRDADVLHRHGGTSVARLPDGSRRSRLRPGIFLERSETRASPWGTVRACSSSFRRYVCAPNASFRSGPLQSLDGDHRSQRR